MNASRYVAFRPFHHATHRFSHNERPIFRLVFTNDVSSLFMHRVTRLVRCPMEVQPSVVSSIDFIFLHEFRESEMKPLCFV